MGFEERKILTLESTLTDVIERTEYVAAKQEAGHAFSEISCAILVLAREIKEMKEKFGNPIDPRLFNHGQLARLSEGYGG